MKNIIENFSQIAFKYKAIFCDLWGCIHNGKTSFRSGLKALSVFKAQGGTVILLTNAPRPSEDVIKHLNDLGITKEFYDGIVTSGDATRISLRSGEFGYNVYHIGPKRDLCFFNFNEKTKTNPNQIKLVEISEASMIICTGLVNDLVEAPSDYCNILNLGVKNKLPLLCANPDMQVDYGHKRLWCAGAIADYYSKIGGKSIYFGKPHKPIYDLAIAKLRALNSSISKSEIICVGDGIFTDISGGLSYGLDTLFVAGGLSSSDTGLINGETSPNEKKLKNLFEKTNFKPTSSIGFFQ